MLLETEKRDALVRRYQAPDEHPFFPNHLPEPFLQPLNYPSILHENDVNINSEIKDSYINQILPAACKKFNRPDRGEKQENYGSAATIDVSLLQALSRRIHFGKFVAESKFRSETDRFVKLIKAEDREGIAEAITKKAVELKVLERLQLKAEAYGKDPASVDSGDSKINVDAVVTMYRVCSLGWSV